MASQFETVLRSRVDTLQQAILEARRVGDGYAASLHRARLEDLLGLAERSDLDTTGWIDPAFMSPTTTAQATTDAATLDQD
jgi:hypothetical protein